MAITITTSASSYMHCNFGGPPSGSLMSMVNGFTVSVWCYASGTNGVLPGVTDNNGQGLVGMQQQTQNLLMAQVNVHSLGNGSTTNINMGSILTANKWNHICWVFIPNWWATGYASQIQCWVNGVQRTLGLGAPNSSQTPNAMNNLYLWSALNSSSQTNYSNPNGVGEFAAWTVPLTPTEVQLLSSGVNPLRIRPLSLPFYWPLNTADLMTNYGYAPKTFQMSNVGAPVVSPFASPPVAKRPKNLFQTGVFCSTFFAAPGPGAWNLNGNTAPALSLGATMSPAAGALNLLGGSVPVSATANLFPSSGLLALVGSTPPATMSALLAPSAAEIDLYGGSAPDVAADAFVDPAPGALELSGPSPDVSADAISAPSAAEIDIATTAPDVSSDANTAPSAAALELSGPSPNLSLGVTYYPGAAAWSLTGSAPDVSADAISAPSAAALDLATTAPDLTTDNWFTPAPAAMTIAGAPGHIEAGFTACPPGGYFSLRSATPSVSTGVSVVPAAGEILFAATAPTFSASLFVTPPAASLSLAGHAAAVAADAHTEPGAAAIHLGTAGIPTVSTGVGVSPTAGRLLFAGGPAALMTEAFLAPGPAVLDLSGPAPNVSTGVTLAPAGTAIRLAVGPAPTVSAGVTADPLPGVLVWAGGLPAVQITSMLGRRRVVAPEDIRTVTAPEDIRFVLGD